MRHRLFLMNPSDKPGWRGRMMQDENQPVVRWDSRQEESWFTKLEEQFSQELCVDRNFLTVANGYAARFGELVRRLPEGYSTHFLVDLICSVNCLVLRAWRDYVQANWESADQETLRDSVDRLPKLDDYLSSVNLETSIVKRFPTLAKEDLVARNAYADGGRHADYLSKYGLKIQSPDPSLVIVPRIESEAQRNFLGTSFVEEHGLANVRKEFHLLQRFSIGRQRTSETPPFDVTYGDGQHRMIIAKKMDSRAASREQLELAVLTPQVLYLKNTGGYFTMHIHAVQGASRVLGLGESCLVASDVKIHCNKVQLEIVCTQSERRQ